MSKGQVRITYNLDWPLEQWLNEGMSSRLVLDTLNRHSEEFRLAFKLATMVQTTTTGHSLHNMIKFVVVLTLNEEDLTYLLLKYPERKRQIGLDQ